jgi:hypothetical protein
MDRKAKLKTIREILKAQANKPWGTKKKSYLKESQVDDGGRSSEFAYIVHCDYDNKRVVE